MSYLNLCMLPAPLMCIVSNAFGRYLLGTLTYGLSLRTSSSASMVIAYSDADCDGCPDNRRSTTGSAIFLGHNLIAWRAKKQPTGLLHTLLAETCWIHHILCELGVFIRDPIRVLCDNVSSKYMTRNPVHDHSKHIDVNFHFVRDKVVQKILWFNMFPHTYNSHTFSQRASPLLVFVSYKTSFQSLLLVQIEGVYQNINSYC